MVHAPGIAAHPATELVGVWARRPAAAAELAALHQAEPFADPADLIAASDAIAFAVPPAVQAELALAAVEAGRHLILEKPIASTVDDAARLTEAVATANLASIVFLTGRFAAGTRAWLAELAGIGGWRTGNGRWLSGGLLNGVFSNSPWRHRDGALADVGPHVIDMLDAALGEVTDVLAAHKAEPDVWHLVFGHAGGATSTASLSMKLPVQPTVTAIDVYGDNGHSSLGGNRASPPECFGVLLDEFTTMVRSGQTDHQCDVRRGLHLQRLIEAGYRLAQA